MPGNEERDPLDSWLHQQVEPLPPPPGTFELITRRARRRKLRTLAVTVASAAAVAAGVAVAVPNVLALHVSQSPTAANPLANGHSPTHPRPVTEQPNGSASPDVTPTPGPSPLREPSGPVPPNFRPSSVTFVSPDVGWVIGQAGAPGHCANPDPYICTSIARTDDAGKTWHGGPAPDTGGQNGPKGVTGIRFLDGVNGWAFGPELWVTHDAGNTWHQVDTHGQRVTDLETAGDRAFALWASCSGTGSTAFAADCTSYTLMTTPKGGDNWTPAGTATSGLTFGGSPTSAVLALTSTTGYLLGPHGTVYSGPIDGAWEKTGLAGCQPGSAAADGLPSGALLALVNSDTVVVACNAPGGVRVTTSPDGGMTWVAQPDSAWASTARPASATSLAAAPDGTLTLATANGIYVLPAGGSHWKQAAVQNAPASDFSYVGMTTNAQGVALPADTTLHEIWMTFDGGLTWAPATSITPGN